MSKSYLFVGERPSDRAIQMGVTLKDGRLAAKPLFEALRAIGIDPEQCRFTNLFFTKREIPNPLVVKRLGLARKLTIVGMGQKVQGHLVRLGIKHIGIVHPAARGKIRKSCRYKKHIKSILGG